MEDLEGDTSSVETAGRTRCVVLLPGNTSPDS